MISQPTHHAEADIACWTYLERNLARAQLLDQGGVLQTAHAVTNTGRVCRADDAPDTCWPDRLAGMRHTCQAGVANSLEYRSKPPRCIPLLYATQPQRHDAVIPRRNRPIRYSHRLLQRRFAREIQHESYRNA